MRFFYHITGTIIVFPNSQPRTPSCIPVPALPAPGGQAGSTAVTSALALAMGDSPNFPVCSDHRLQPHGKTRPAFSSWSSKTLLKGFSTLSHCICSAKRQRVLVLVRAGGSRFRQRGRQQETINFLSLTRSITKVITVMLPIIKGNSTSAKWEESFDYLPLNKRCCCKRPVLVTAP